MKITGSCFCGSIKFAGTTNIDNIIACHCTDCQIFSGAPFRAVAICPQAEFSMTGTPKEFVKIGDSGNKRIQAFCDICGTHLFATDTNKSMFNVRMGCIDQRDNLTPARHVFSSSAQSWVSEVLTGDCHIAGPDSEKL